MKNTNRLTISDIIKIELPVIGKMPKRQAATYLSEKYPTMFANPEKARSCIRYRTGNMGTTSSTNQNAIIPDTFGKLPEERQEVPVDPFIIPTGIDKMLILPDIHSIFCNKEALELAIQYGIDNKCDAVLINGDMVDFYSVSSFCTDPTIGHFKAEREWAKMFLSMLQSLFPVVYYKSGNHEERLKKYLWRNANRIFSEDLLTLQDLFMFDGSLINYIHEAQLVAFGKLAILHGHEVRKGGIINISRNKFLGAYSNILFSHHHRPNEDYVKDIWGHFFGSWSTGCLCRLKVGYDPFNQWMNGFAVVRRIGKDGNFAVDNKKIINDKII